MKILKNTTISDIELKAIGLTIPASGQITVNQQDYLLLASDDSITEITVHINSGDIVINDGVTDLVAARAIDYASYPDTAFGVRFKSDPERVNGFVSKNVQEAIEEARQGGSEVIGRTFSTIFFNNGNTANKWLFHVPTSDATDQLPYYNYWDIEVFGISFSNKNSNINCDVEFYINGTNNPAKIYTLEVRDSKFAHITTLTSLFQSDVGDLISCFIRKVGNSTPSSVEVDIDIRIRTNNVGAGSSN